MEQIARIRMYDVVYKLWGDNNPYRIIVKATSLKAAKRQLLRKQRNVEITCIERKYYNKE
jgi:hypothetical protein